MLEAVLVQRKIQTKVKVTIKSLVSAGLIVLAVVLPQLVHLALGASGGILLLPMYLPVLIGGCLLGTWWGLGIGVLSPALERLPFMIAELAVFAAVSGLFSKSISKNKWMAFPAVLFAAVAGRAVFIALVAIFGSFTSLSVGLVWTQIKTGIVGLVLQAVVVPLIIIALSKLLKSEREDG